MRLAYWNTDLNRDGPGLLLRDLEKTADPTQDSASDLRVATAVIAALQADVLVISGFDYDAGGLALAALNRGLPQPYPHLVPLRPNTGVASGFDLDGNGRRGEARDALGHGRFPGEGGLAILSRLPVDAAAGADHSGLLWRDLPGADLPPLPAGAAEVLPLSTTGHHDTALVLPDGRRLHLLTWHATPPAFDGPEGRNVKRNHDETAFWLHLLDSPQAPPPPFVLIGQANLDPDKGNGDASALRALLSDARVQDVLAGDTVDYGGALGPLRVAYILPSAGITVTAAGHAPQPEGARHHPIWVEISP
ncbi:endonuclease/exonuclease/phosphatase family protein [Pseudorhodobacter sp. MZDSW-24AT]|uniref:endonuclease/exonuclease/phosphatase family protein n=1 Tax=Pseudorhodobacter sp. MZDSW-24AT TaxID=2052957 RepID=UPI001E609F58|nr:endonuclease/exonuclease/phosphatase family protein [Pseudorhodobacter sp. MZDSW-24AT]